jgi:hypothetical protein
LFELIPIPGVEDKRYKVRALVINGKSRVIDFLNSFPEKSPEFKKIIQSIRLVCEKGKKCSENRLKPDRNKTGVYEIKAPNCVVRIYCFFDMDGTIIICSDAGKKSGGSQTRDFDTCRKLKEMYFIEEGR